MDFDGLVALVTGVGEATTTALIERGARVAILDLPASSGAASAGAHGDAAISVPADVTDAAAAQAAIAQAVDHFGALHVAVNCAGIGVAQCTVQRGGDPHDLDAFSRIIQVNLIGTFNIIRLAAARMLANDPNANGERGVIINAASIAAFDGQIGQVAYANPMLNGETIRLDGALRMAPR